MLANLEFGEVKKLWRGWLDTEFDHHMLLNRDDPIFDMIQNAYTDPNFPPRILNDWGITFTDHGDPTVENVARMLYEGAKKMFDTRPNVPLKFHIHLKEAATNGASYGEGPF
jgi:6-pyruvoyl-tetrahydropterin synthase